MQVRKEFDGSKESRDFFHGISPVSSKKDLDFDQLGSDQCHLMIKDFEDKLLTEIASGLSSKSFFRYSPFKSGLIEIF